MTRVLPELKSPLQKDMDMTQKNESLAKRTFFTAFQTKQMKIITKIDIKNAFTAILADQGIQYSGNRVIDQGNIFPRPPDQYFIQNFNCRRINQHGCTGFYIYLNAVFFKQIVSLPFQFSG